MTAGRNNTRVLRRRSEHSNRNGDLNRTKTHRMRSNMGMNKENNISSVIDALKEKQKKEAVKS